MFGDFAIEGDFNMKNINIEKEAEKSIKISPLPYKSGFDTNSSPPKLRSPLKCE